MPKNMKFPTSPEIRRHFCDCEEYELTPTPKQIASSCNILGNYIIMQISKQTSKCFLKRLPHIFTEETDHFVFK